MTYTYKCKGCGEVFEVKQKMHHASLTDCPHCEEKDVLERVIQTAGGFRIWGRGVHAPTSSLRS
jgi:putative FmdB family regulatory protein